MMYEWRMNDAPMMYQWRIKFQVSSFTNLNFFLEKKAFSLCSWSASIIGLGEWMYRHDSFFILYHIKMTSLLFLYICNNPCHKTPYLKKNCFIQYLHFMAKAELSTQKQSESVHSTRASQLCTHVGIVKYLFGPLHMLVVWLIMFLNAVAREHIYHR